MTLFFFDDFETDDFSLWDTDNSGANLFTSAASALAGSFGCEVDSGCFGCGDGVSQNLDGSFPATSVIRVGWKFSRNDLALTSAQYIELAELTPLTEAQLLSARVINDGGSFEIHAVLIDDVGAEHTAEAAISSGTKNVEIRIVSAATAVSNDGSIEIYVDGGLIDSASGIDNHTKFNDLNNGIVSLGADQNNNDASSGSMYVDNFTVRDDDTPIFPGAATDEYLVAPMTKPFDVDSDDSFLYIAALDSLSQPVLIKIIADLSAIGSIVFEPAAGDNIGVECGRFDADVIWIGGNFGTNKLEKSEDAGSSFVVKDDGTFADIEAFVVGPDSDDRVLVADETIEIQETVNSGDTWTQINASAGFNVNAIARLGINVQEAVFGNDAGVSNAITYSPNTGDDMEDFTTGDFPTTSNVTKVAVN